MKIDKVNQQVVIMIVQILVTTAWSQDMSQNNDALDAFPLSLEKAITIAIEMSPALRAMENRVHASEAAIFQARLLPNPEIKSEAENIAGSGELSGTDAAEFTVQVSQPFLLGGKRSKRVRVAELEWHLVKWTYESTKRELIKTVTSTFAEVLEDQEQVELSEELVHISKELVKTAKRRVTSGAASVLEQIKAEIERAASIAKQEQMKQRLTASRRMLAMLLGIVSTKLGSVKGDLYQLYDIPSFDTLKQQLASNPDWARWSTEIEQRRAAVALEDAQRIPDVTIGVGWRRDEGTASDAFIVAAGLPLPLFDRNQGSRRAARYEQAAADEERRKVELELERELTAAYSELSQAHAQSKAIKEKILPAANKAFEVSHEGYLQGRFRYLDLLDAQRTLFETRGRYVETLRMYHQAIAKIERLTNTNPNIVHVTTEE